MVQPTLGLRLRDKLGPEATHDLSHAFQEVQDVMLTLTVERFEARLEARLTAVASELRQEMARMDAGIRITLAEGLSKIRADLDESRVELMRWSFYFWIGQFTATIALIGLLLRFFTR